jgi:hypothetical protein
MKIRISTPGDSPVGIWGDEIEIDWNIISIDADERKYIRGILHEAFTEICDNGPADVWFDDECPDCRTLFVNGICPNSSCINNLCKPEESDESGNLQSKENMERNTGKE